jgi:hypothetical protein
LLCNHVQAQHDTSRIIHRIIPDTSGAALNMDAAFNRPGLSFNKMPVAIGGYLEFNTFYAQTDGVSDGFSFQMRRLTLFMSSAISKRIRFLTEIEFEDGTKEINIENATLDFEFHPLINLRGGIILNPIGAYNQNHDGPKWDFVDRPYEATTIIPATLSNAGFGLHGKAFIRDFILGYEAYLTNGFDDHVISNSRNRTSLAEGKKDPEKFEESNSGTPMFTGKLALRKRGTGEIGISYMSGVYNKWKEDGLIIDEKRTARAMAFDFNLELLSELVSVTGEIAKVEVEVPQTYSQAFGEDQFGGFIDVMFTLLQKRMLGWEQAKLSAGFRGEYVDYNTGKFRETNGKIADDLWALTPAVSFRPTGNTVLRLNYRYQHQQDLLGNPAAHSGFILFGCSSYF